MAISRLIRSRTYLCAFAETETGIFGFVNDTATDKTVTSNASVMRVVFVGTDDIQRSPDGISGGSKITQVTNAIVSTNYSSTSSTYRIKPDGTKTTYGYGNKVSIVDAHGTHYGTPTGTSNQAPASNYALGVMHNTTADGYTFGGWKVTIKVNQALYTQPTIISSGGTTVGEVTTFPSDYAGAIIISTGRDYSADITIEAIYTPIPVTRTISLDANGGTVSPSSVSCTGTYADAVAITPTWAQHLFLGWFDAASGGNEITASTELTQSSPSTLYAHWEEIPVGTVSITYVLNGGTGGPESTTVTEGSTYTIPQDVPTRESYTFDGWFVGSETILRQPGYQFTANEDTTISAQWSGGPTPPTPRPEEEKGYMVRSASSEFLMFSVGSGAIVYAV